MSAVSSPDNKACLEMWRNAVPITWQQRVVEQIVRRERLENNLIQDEIEAAERSLARLQLAAGPQGGEDEDEEYEVSDFSSQIESASTVEAVWERTVSFADGDHPENRDPMRRGTPVAPPTEANVYLADDETELPRALRRKTRSSASFNVSLPSLTPTPEPLQSPVHSLRSLRSSEVWDDAAEPILYAPVPLRPLIQPELLLVGYHEEPCHESAVDQRLERVTGLLDDLKRLHKDLDSILRQRRAISQADQENRE